jgi:gamma-glutamylcyclotransferase (GGCT)/AIG2-like uncharacterized protein YtfP
MNLEHMSHRCPTAKVKGVGSLINWNLVFRSEGDEAFATIEPFENGRVLVVIWDIKPSDEEALDVYEEYPLLYRKEVITAELEGEELEAMVYIMNGDRALGKPSQRYYETLKQGYIDNGIDVKILDDFLFV